MGVEQVARNRPTLSPSTAPRHGLPAVAVLGGDEREHHIASALASHGLEVRAFGGPVTAPGSAYKRAGSAREAVTGASWVLCPYPGLGVRDEIYAPACDLPLRLDRELLTRSTATAGGLILGRASAQVRVTCEDLGIPVYETKADSGLAVQTATAVSEALLGVLIESTDRLLREHLFLVIGMGSTGFAITQLLLALRCEVVVAARSKRDRERARQIGARPIPYSERVSLMGTADIIVNTVPDPEAVPTRTGTSQTAARIFDIASPPGGMDHQALVGMGLDVQWVRGLGGLRAPVSMAEAQLAFIRGLVQPAGDDGVPAARAPVGENDPTSTARHEGHHPAHPRGAQHG